MQELEILSLRDFGLKYHFEIFFSAALFTFIFFTLPFNVEGYSCDVTHGLDFSSIASPIKI